MGRDLRRLSAALLCELVLLSRCSCWKHKLLRITAEVSRELVDA